MSTFRALWRTWHGSINDAWANRRSFWFQASVMVVNDAFWIVFWVIFFEQLGEVRGWVLQDVIVLQAVLTSVGGVSLGLLNNSRHLGRLIADGAIDEALVLPVATLPYLLVRRIEPVNIGDLAFGVGVFAVAGSPTPGRVAAFVVAVLIGSVALVSFLVIAGSTAFLGGRSDVGELGFHSVVLFASYPVDVFSGFVKVLMFTVVPAGFITALPTRFVRDLEFWHAGVSAAFAIGLALAAALVFRLGLRRYTSGAMWAAA